MGTQEKLGFLPIDTFQSRVFDVLEFAAERF
jgi:hypothetical protein